MPIYQIGGADAALIELSAQHLSGRSVDEVDKDTGERESYFYLGDEESAVEIMHEIGDPEMAAIRLLAAAEEMRKHAEHIRYRERLRTAGWT